MSNKNCEICSIKKILGYCINLEIFNYLSAVHLKRQTLLKRCYPDSLDQCPYLNHFNCCLRGWFPIFISSPVPLLNFSLLFPTAHLQAPSHCSPEPEIQHVFSQIHYLPLRLLSHPNVVSIHVNQSLNCPGLKPQRDILDI